jgi:hypothetical protein
MSEPGPSLEPLSSRGVDSYPEHFANDPCARQSDLDSHSPDATLAKSDALFALRAKCNIDNELMFPLCNDRRNTKVNCHQSAITFN